MNNLLLVEDKESLALVLKQALEASGFRVTAAASAAAASRALQKGEAFSAVVTDLRLPDRDGISVLREVKQSDPDCPVIVMTAYGTIEQAVEAMKLGAFDFVQKPVDVDHLILLLRRCQEHRLLRHENVLLRDDLQRAFGVPQIVGESRSIRSVSQQIQRVAPTDATVLLLGESGTGKELFARAIHQLSPRRPRPFVAINCAAIPESLLENELFGHEKGAYTGANARQHGKFELADTGTIFLDEIGDMGLSVQSKILRVLQEKTFERLGGAHELHSDVRVICATNRDLKAEVEAGRFREDLYYRISVFPVLIPPLRERRDDIKPLVDFYLDRFRRELGRPHLSITQPAIDRLVAYGWPGNVRELQNCIERAAILCDAQAIDVDDLSITEADGRHPDSPFDLTGSLSDVTDRALQIVEKAKIEQVLAGEKSRSRAAEKLGINYRTLLNKLKQYGIEEESR